MLWDVIFFSELYRGDKLTYNLMYFNDLAFAVDQTKVEKRILRTWRCSSQIRQSVESTMAHMQTI